MPAVTPPRPRGRLRCYYRPALLVAFGLGLACLFWFASRYPSLLRKAEHTRDGVPVATMAYGGEAVKVAADAPAWQRVGAAAVNWLDGMKVGMTFGVLFGALLHTVLRYYPLKIGDNLYLNSVKGALVGAPMGVCANCAVPLACGVTRGRGRVEVALGFLFSSPNFNPIVLAMTFTALPPGMAVTKYAVLVLVIAVVVPGLVRWLERGRPLGNETADKVAAECPVRLPPPDCEDRLGTVLRELAGDYARHVWMLLRPTLVLMLLASVVSAALLTFVPWHELLAEVTPLKLAVVTPISVFMPVPIALDVMFPAQLQAQGVPAGYVMLFAMTLGTFSIVPAVYLWREVSRRLAVLLLGFFTAVGYLCGLIF
ncbi:MAG: permease [Gemmataceae bacterium]|nr:permease [Gemmataceae bacterium]